MSYTLKTNQRLLPEYTYHLYNRGINGQMICFQPKNYLFLLRRYAYFTKSYIDTCAYCLLPNHFHFLVTLKSTEAILVAASSTYKIMPKALLKSILVKRNEVRDQTGFENLSGLNTKNQIGFQNLSSLDMQAKSFIASWFVSNQLRLFFGSYAKAINKQETRTGSLFERPFKRKLVDDKKYMDRLIWYIHRNPLHHGIYTQFEQYPYSSYPSLLSEKPTLLQRKKVLAYFGGREAFINFHQLAGSNWSRLNQYIIE